MFHIWCTIFVFFIRCKSIRYQVGNVTRIGVCSVHFIFIETKKIDWICLDWKQSGRIEIAYDTMDWNWRQGQNKRRWRRKQKNKQMWVAFNERMAERWIRVLLVYDVEQRNRSIEYTNKQSAIRQRTIRNKRAELTFYYWITVRRKSKWNGRVQVIRLSYPISR